MYELEIGAWPKLFAARIHCCLGVQKFTIKEKTLMRNNTMLFCMNIVICGLIVSIWIALSVTILGNYLFPKWYGTIRILTVMIFLASIYGSFRSKVVCRFICRQARDVKNESSPTYRIERYVIRRWKHQDIIEGEFSSLDLINTPGRRSRYPDERKRYVIEKWDKIKQSSHNIFLEEFLEVEFGTTNGVLNVSRSTFYSWRRKFRKNGKKGQKN